jgi:hypothetical protein
MEVFNLILPCIYETYMLSFLTYRANGLLFKFCESRDNISGYNRRVFAIIALL